MRSAVLIAGLLTASTVLAQAPDSHAPMTSSEAVRLIQLLEQAPLAESARKVRADLIDWAAETNDVTITICDVLGPIPNSTVPYGPELLVQAMFGNGAFQIQHPERKGNEYKAQLAGIESMLRAYERIIKADPTARIPQYDEWLGDLKAGRLEAKIAPSIQEKCVDAPAEA